MQSNTEQSKLLFIYRILVFEKLVQTHWIYSSCSCEAENYGHFLVLLALEGIDKTNKKL